MTKEQAEKEIRDTFTKIWADGIIKALEQEPTTKNDLEVDWDELKRKILMEVDGGTDDRWLRYADVCDNISNSIDDFKADLLPVTPQEPKWIPISEELPKVADCYAVTRQIGSDLIVDACFFDGTNTWHNDNRINHERNYLTNIVAWMPLPKPYKAESEEE